MSIYKNHIINSLISRFLVAFCMMGVVVVTSHVLGAEGRGKIGYYLLIITLAQGLVEFLGGSAIINLSPKHKTINLLLPSYLLSFLVSITLFGYLLAVEKLDPINGIYLSLSCLFLGLSSMNLSFILGRKQINQRNFIYLFLNLIFLASIYYFYWIDNNTSDYFAYFRLFMFAYMVGFILSIIKVFKLSSQDDMNGFEWKRDLFFYGFLSQCGQLVNLLNYRISYFFIESHYGMAKLGVFSNAMTVGDMMKIPGQSIGMVQHNKIVNHRNEVHYGLRITPRYLAINTILYLFQWFFILMLPSFFWTWLLGAEFETLKTILIILLPGFVALGISTIYAHFFHAVNAFKTVLLANTIGLFILIVSSFVLMPIQGFNGVLYAIDLGYASILMVLIIAYGRKKGEVSFLTTPLKQRWNILKRLSKAK